MIEVARYRMDVSVGNVVLWKNAERMKVKVKVFVVVVVPDKVWDSRISSRSAERCALRLHSVNFKRAFCHLSLLLIEVVLGYFLRYELH